MLEQAFRRNFLQHALAVSAWMQRRQAQGGIDTRDRIRGSDVEAQLLHAGRVCLGAVPNGRIRREAAQVIRAVGAEPGSDGDCIRRQQRDRRGGDDRAVRPAIRFSEGWGELHKGDRACADELSLGSAELSWPCGFFRCSARDSLSPTEITPLRKVVHDEETDRVELEALGCGRCRSDIPLGGLDVFCEKAKRSFPVPSGTLHLNVAGGSLESRS